MRFLDSPPDPAGSLLDTWNEILDQFEHALHHADAQGQRAGDLASEIDTAVLFVPPATMPPFPLELADRARRLLALNADVQDRLAAASSRLRRSAASGTSVNPRSTQGRHSTTASSFEAFA